MSLTVREHCMIKAGIIRSKILRNSAIFVNYGIDSYGLKCPNYSPSQLDPTMPAGLALNCCPPLGGPAPCSGAGGTTAFKGIREALRPQSHMKRGAGWDVGAASPRLPVQLRLSQ